MGAQRRAGESGKASWRRQHLTHNPKDKKASARFREEEETAKQKAQRRKMRKRHWKDTGRPGSVGCDISAALSPFHIYQHVPSHRNEEGLSSPLTK